MERNSIVETRINLNKYCESCPFIEFKTDVIRFDDLKKNRVLVVISCEHDELCEHLFAHLKNHFEKK